MRLSVNTANPELDGRYIYIGHVPPKTTMEIDTIIPISEDGERALASTELELSVIVRVSSGLVFTALLPSSARDSRACRCG